MTMLRAEALRKSYRIGDQSLTILDGVDLTLAEGEMAAIVGASGSGKTTLLQILGTLARPDSGALYFRDRRLDQLDETAAARFRNLSLGFMFQFHHLLPEFSALENVLMPALIAGKNGQAKRAEALALLDTVELGHRAGHRVNEMSGGEQQRTALARALIMKPAVLLADEPTGNLDTRSGRRVFELLRTLCRERGLAALMVTHNLELAARMDCRYTLQDGRLG
ncbi:MAG: ABC transporter ATP-binding protein [Desulfobulbaceae bacterium]|jgi:lipoprotein-releasing system ATP-binding protein|nr:ABC transporter ATP-binding protein [Desulfobulbaceae bacterium]